MLWTSQMFSTLLDSESAHDHIEMLSEHKIQMIKQDDEPQKLTLNTCSTEVSEYKNVVTQNLIYANVRKPNDLFAIVTTT